MPDNTDDDFDVLLDSLPEDQLNSVFKKLRDERKALAKEVRELRPLKAQLETSQREDAFTTAGLKELSAEKRTALLAVAGENVDAAGLKAAAATLGFVAPDPAAQGRQDAAQADADIANQTGSATGHVPADPTLVEQIQQAEAAKDWKTASRLKLGLMKLPGS